MSEETFELPRLLGRVDDVATVFIDGRVQLAKLKGGTWRALNHWSESPLYLANKHERATWALVQGMLVMDVQAYVRRKKKQDVAERLADEVNCAIKLLTLNGYEVKANA